MCYFINLKITPEGKPNEAKIAEIKSLLERLAKQEKVVLQGAFPTWQISSCRDCGCDDVLQNGAAITKANLAAELVRNAAVKNIQIGWTWARDADIAMKPDAPTERITIEEFLTRSANFALQDATWYRMNDASKYERASE